MANQTTYTETLSLLIRMSNTAKKVLDKLSEGNPYHAVSLLKLIFRMDLAELERMRGLPNYHIIRPYHEELLKECAAILALCKEAVQMFSEELEQMPPEDRKKAAESFQLLIREMDNELNAERDLSTQLKELSMVLNSYAEKAWTRSKIRAEAAFEIVSELVKDEQAMKVTVERFAKIFQYLKDPPHFKKFLTGVIGRRLKVMRTLKWLLENAFKSGYSFKFGMGNWQKAVSEIINLPLETIKELESFRSWLLSNAIAAKRNVNFQKLEDALKRIVALAGCARNVGKALEVAERQTVQNAKTDEELLHRHWEKNVHEKVVYHGTSTAFLENIQRSGLSSEGMASEKSPFKLEDFLFFINVSKKAYGADAAHLSYFTEGVTQGFFVDGNYAHAVNYARQGPERIRFLKEHIAGMVSEFRRGSFSSRVSQQEISKLIQISEKYEKALANSKPIVLHIPAYSQGMLSVLQKNGEQGAFVARMVVNYETYKEYALSELGHSRELLAEPFPLGMYLEGFDPLERFFHDRPLRGTIPWSDILKFDYV